MIFGNPKIREWVNENVIFAEGLAQIIGIMELQIKS